MKKLLLASAALALSAGLASAQGVALSGDARMGVDYDDTRGGPNVSNWQMTSRARVTFTLSGTTDTGLSFGATFRADNAAAAAGNNEMSGGNVFIRGAFGTLRMGDVEGAARFAVGDLGFTTLTAIGDPHEMGYIDRLQQGPLRGVPPRRTAARYDSPTFEGFTFSVSLDQFRSFGGNPVTLSSDFAQFGGATITLATPVGSTRARGWAVGASYDFGMGKVMAGYEELRLSSDAPTWRATHLIVGAQATFEGITVKGIYGRAGGDFGDFLADSANVASRDQYGASVSANFDDVTVSVFGNRDFFRTTKVGVGASYNLGGGISVVGSVARQNGRFIDGTKTLELDGSVGRSSRTRADFGVAMSF